jgi:hypothetical protein
MTDIIELNSIDDLIGKGNPSSLSFIIQAIATIDDPITREGYIGSVVKYFKVSKKTITQMMQAMISQQTDEADVKPTVTAKMDNLIDLASNSQGNSLFLIENILTGSLEQYSSYNDGRTDLIPPAVNQIPYLLPRAVEVFGYYAKDDASLMQDLILYLKRFCHVTDGQAIIMATAVFASYLQDHHDINYLPIISLIGEPERGKSRLGMAATFASYRGVVLNGIREAHIIRLAEDYSATIFIDLRAAWKKVVGEKCEDILLGRYEKGHQIMRVISPEKGAFADSRFFKAYGPTYIASNEPLDRILETRCIPLIMESHPAEYEKATEQHGQEFRERLVAWRAKTLSRSLPRVESVPCLQGRFWDISDPLLRICGIVCSDYYETLKSELIRISAEKVETKRISWEGVIVQQLLGLMVSSNVSTNNGLIKLDDLLKILNAMVLKSQSISSQSLGLKLKGMGLKTKHVQGHSYIIIDRIKIDTLRQQCGIELPEGTVTDPNLTLT